MAEKYTNIRVILDKITKHPLLSSITLELAVDYTVDFMNIVGTPAIFTNAVAEVEVEKHRGQLPCDYISLIQVKGKNGVYRHATNNFHLAPNQPATEQTFIIQGGYIFTSLPTDTLIISYESIAVDSDGYPLIPEDSKFTRALAAYIKKEYFTVLFDTQRINGQVLQQAQQDYAWAVGACDTHFNRLDLSKAEAFANLIRSPLIKSNQFNEGFENLGTQIYLNRH